MAIYLQQFDKGWLESSQPSLVYRSKLATLHLHQENKTQRCKKYCLLSSHLMFLPIKTGVLYINAIHLGNTNKTSLKSCHARLRPIH